MIGSLPILKKRGGAIVPAAIFNRVEFDAFRKE